MLYVREHLSRFIHESIVKPSPIWRIGFESRGCSAIFWYTYEMYFRDGYTSDIPKLIALDKQSYGKFGANEDYFKEKLTSPTSQVLIQEQNNSIIGFAVFEIMQHGQPIPDFKKLKIANEITEKYMHLIAFTSRSNYEDYDTDLKLLIACEEKASLLNCNTFCVPLSIKHPYPRAFTFFEKNGYKKIGTIQWVANDSEFIDCYFYCKSAKV